MTMSGLEIIGLALALPGILDLIVKAAKSVAQRVEKLNNAESLVEELRIFGVLSEEKLLRLRFDTATEIWNDPHVDRNVKDALDENFKEIQKIINETTVYLDAIARERTRRYLFLRESHARQALELSVRRLKQLADDFGKTILLIRANKAGSGATYIPTQIFQTTNDVRACISDNVKLVRCSLSATFGNFSPRVDLFVVETRAYTPGLARTTVGENIRHLAETLVSTRPCEGIPGLVGYTENTDANCYELIFAIPDGLEFRTTLRDLLITAGEIPPLNIRVGLCTQLANAILHVHSLELVHKNVNPASIAVMAPKAMMRGAENHHGFSVFLFDWQYTRSKGYATRLAGETLWWKAIYQHPTRQMALADSEYKMGHDIYSLGVCMMEILLWKSFIEYGEDIARTVSPLFIEKAIALRILDEGTKISDPIFESEHGKASPEDVQRVLIDIAKSKLPAVAGDKLTGLVVFCLSCLEDGFSQVSFVQNSGLEIGMNFMATVKGSLAQICI